MKTSEQNSKEIMEKIEKRKYVRLQVRKRVRRIWAAVVIFAFLVPTTLFSITEDFTHYRPMSYPFEKEEPFEEEPNSDSQMQKSEPDAFQIVLPL